MTVRQIKPTFRPHCIPADGVPRGVLVVNRMLPGPGIHVCEGDTVIVNVVNGFIGGEGTSIHWHGVLQNGSPHMDGVGMVTQCPIPIGTSFEYRFNATNAGTHLWHAHSGLQRSDGIFGAFIVRQADEFEPHLGLYEHDLPEHTVIVNDWLGELTENKFARHHHAGGDNRPKSILINGKGVYKQVSKRHGNTSRNYTPVEVFHVRRGQRYRFRIISNGVLNCPKQISVDNHTLTMIASDGNAFEKIDVESFNIFAGERYDFVLNASNTVGNYWIRVRGLADCEPEHAKQVAVLRYEGAPEKNPVEGTSWLDGDRSGKKLNPWNRKGDGTHIPVTELRSPVNNTDALKAIPDKKFNNTDALKPIPDKKFNNSDALKPIPDKKFNNSDALKPIPDKKFYLAMDFNKIDDYHFHDEMYYPLSALNESMHLYVPQINHVSLILPPSPPLTQLQDLDEEIFCNHETNGSRNCTEVYCECVYLLQVGLNDVVELVILDEGETYNANHPMHLHGHKYYVVGMDKLGETVTLDRVKQLDGQGKLHRNLADPVAKDTVTIPDGGYTILRFHANNPGFWFFHCHIEFHVGIGMGLLFQVGNITDLPQVPKHFPKCGNWKI
ncbi:uncharacterized protein LOC123556290 [Mercenaria mercenaria]|uniref:uncharacterized protein LOC123556290 n=1 Tax=Mercenaria mercenaria TaxID=6596 RepID=UPI00234F9A24|nr:uncharacterized protein LOC123556290 [Mercenaria mercenaria]